MRPMAVVRCSVWILDTTTPRIKKDWRIVVDRLRYVETVNLGSRCVKREALMRTSRRDNG